MPDIKKTLGFFYSDVSENAVLVASSNSDNSLVPIELGASNVVKYDVTRSKVKIFKLNRAKNAVGHIRALDELYDGKDISEIDVGNIDAIYTFLGQDWYIAIKSDYTIEKYIMKNSNNISKAQEEMDACLLYVQEHMKDIQISINEEYKMK